MDDNEIYEKIEDTRRDLEDEIEQLKDRLERLEVIVSDHLGLTL